MSLQFHETVMGHRFFESSVPKLIKAIEEQNALLRAQNELMAEQTRLLASLISKNNSGGSDDAFDLPL